MDDDARWRALLAEVAAGLPALVDSFLARILPDPAYAESGITLEDLRRSSVNSFAAMVAALSGRPADLLALESFAAELGARRARQGVPLASLMRAIRLDFSVIWGALSSPSAGADPDLLVRRAEFVWETVDRFAAAVQDRYVAEAEESARADADLQHQYLTQLLAVAEPSANDLLRIAGALRVDPGAVFLVAAVDRNDSLTISRRLRARPPKDAVFLFDQGHHTLVIRRRESPLGEQLTFQEASLLAGMAAGVAPHAAGIAGVRMAASAAREIMKDLPMGSVGIFTVRERWLSITRHRLAQVGCEPARIVHAGLRACGDQERSRILEAVRSFLDTGSLVETAVVLRCHRNTVVNRLAAFEKYTGLDLQKPRDAAAALLALA